MFELVITVSWSITLGGNVFLAVLTALWYATGEVTIELLTIKAAVTPPKAMINPANTNFLDPHLVIN